MQYLDDAWPNDSQAFHVSWSPTNIYDICRQNDGNQLVRPEKEEEKPLDEAPFLENSN